MKRKTKIPRNLPKPTPPNSAAREYYRNLRKYVEKYIELTKFALKEMIPELTEVASNEIPIIRHDSLLLLVRQVRMDTNIEKRIAEMFEWIQRELDSSFSDMLLRNWAKSMITGTDKNAKKNISKVTEKVGLEIEPLLHDRELNPFFQNVIDENVGLIKSIPQEKLATFKNGLVSMISRDMPHAQIAKMIQANFNVTRNKAKFIARDQVGKLNGALNKYRQQQLGGSRYIWRGSKDSREREDHLRLEGQIFSWDKPPITNRSTGARNHPGEDYQCRCHAEMVIEDVLE